MSSPNQTALQNGIKAISIIFFVLSSLSVTAQNVRIVKLEGLQNLMNGERERIQVINFWATWCAPCVKEMPLFEKLNQERKDIAVRLVSMDMDLDPDPEKVRKFVLRKKLQSEVLILDEKNPNAWIDKLEKKWSGALPATLIINNKTGKRKFVEKELHEGDLENLITEVQ